VRERCVFTTHTPVPAGHDRFSMEQAHRILGSERINLIERVGGCHGGLLKMTYIALRFARYVNGVAMQHGKVSRHCAGWQGVKQVGGPGAHVGFTRRGNRTPLAPSDIYASDDDYVFASETMRGKQPFWPHNLMKREIKPVAKANRIHEKIGWHTSRHSFVTLLKANGEAVKAVQELLRHANSKSTLDVYTHAVKPFPPRSD
jgi:Phage integrase family